MVAKQTAVSEPASEPSAGSEQTEKAARTTARKTAKKSTTAKAAEKKTAAARTAKKVEAGTAAEPGTAKQRAAKRATTKKAAARKTPTKKATARKPEAGHDHEQDHEQDHEHQPEAAEKKAEQKAGKSTAKKGATRKAAGEQAVEEAAHAAKQTGAKSVAAKKTGATAAQRSAPSVPKARVVAAEPGELAVRPGEDPWTTEEVAGARTMLAEEAGRLRTEIVASEESLQGLMRDSGDGAGDDQADTGTKNITREHEMALAANAREMLEQTERALERLDAGTYGLCENCGQPIGKARMQAFPRATLCVECKQKQERRS
ncbi:TraR/DksA C4-type zinc finger protein [Streptomyces sp. LHD-70]|uniref:TraR/DksA family transcriptional regulator n=1 Tax=Streptomyces sp. LHD-70 TaxID=3072140 RepID=UPI00280DCD3E|nr:TraR/DksA C4-type zinc finger protein [Streptomyces sp. LHD-70]MDQ8701519.1 TraR/DksA C4-type zinc finger protein [Streptomyces sp. LHD-70]